MRERLLAGERLFALDVIRGFAAVLVLIRHFPPTRLTSHGTIEACVSWCRNIGWIGVDLFFVLSGLLISSLIYREYDLAGRFRPARFLVRRSFKIWPAYFTVYGSAVLLQWFLATHHGNLEVSQGVARDALWNSLFLQNYVACHAWPHSWSIAVEEHFYLGLALIFFWQTWRASGSDGNHAFNWLLIAFPIVAVITLTNRVIVVFPDNHWHPAYYRSHMRIDGLLFGVLLGYLIWYRLDVIRPIARSRLLALIALTVALAVPTIWPLTTSQWCSSVGFTILYLAFGVIVLHAAMRSEAPGASSPGAASVMAVLAWIGVYSYTIYLVHGGMFAIPGFESSRQYMLGKLLTILPESAVLWFDRLGYLAAAIGGGVLVSHLVERPCLRIRSRLCPSTPPRRTDPINEADHGMTEMAIASVSGLVAADSVTTVP